MHLRFAASIRVTLWTQVIICLCVSRHVKSITLLLLAESCLAGALCRCCALCCYAAAFRSFNLHTYVCDMYLSFLLHRAFHAVSIFIFFFWFIPLDFQRLIGWSNQMILISMNFIDWLPMTIKTITTFSFLRNANLFIQCYCAKRICKKSEIDIVFPFAKFTLWLYDYVCVCVRCLLWMSKKDNIFEFWWEYL